MSRLHIAYEHISAIVADRNAMHTFHDLDGIQDFSDKGVKGSMTDTLSSGSLLLP
ncbi:MAG: hypothetical protein ABI656_12855 [bacterium]